MGTQFVHLMLVCSSYTFLILASYLNSSASDFIRDDDSYQGGFSMELSFSLSLSSIHL